MITQANSNSETNVTGTFIVSDEVNQFLARLGKGGSWQYFCDFKEPPKSGLRVIEWFKVGTSIEVPNWRAVYFNVYPQKESLTGKARGGIESVNVMNHLYSEFDMDKGATWEQVEALSPAPSIIIFSGGGWHCYWLLVDTVSINESNCTEMNQVVHGWVKYTSGDGGAKDLARVLRVPTSFNNKPQYGEPIQVIFVKADYTLEYTLNELIDYLPEIKKAKTQTIPDTKAQGLTIQADPSLYAKAVEALAVLSPIRVKDFHQWVEIGMALHRGFDGSDAGLALWDMWSQRCNTYKTGECAYRWGTFDSNREDKITLKRLFDRAQEDSKGTFIKPASKDAKPSDYMEAVHAMGYHFTTNDMNERIFVNGVLMSDGIKSLVMTKLREHGYKNSDVFQDAFVAEGQENKFHPVQEYLNSLVWDGEDNFSKLSEYINDRDGIFEILVRKWFIGAVSRILAPSSKEQNPMLVLAGSQGKGKSVLAQWIGSVLPEYFIASPIFPDNKDFVINASSHFVWEVEELGSTLRRQDIEALKAFISRPMNTFRAPYGRFEIHKPTTASYIGTINLDGNGFLNDPTGNRRYRVCHVTKIDFNYEKLDINQLWAQAVALFKGGETYLLDDTEESRVREINERFEVHDPLAPFVLQNFEIVEDADAFVPSSRVLEILKISDVIPSTIDRAISMRVGNIMTRLGAENTTRRINGKVVRGWARTKAISDNAPSVKRIPSSG